MKQYRKLFAILLCLNLLLPLLPSFARAEGNGNDPAARPGRVLVALGDSFASGEGIGSFFGESLPMEEKCQNEDWLAHRSTQAWACQLRLPGADGSMLENLGTNFFFAASSGAVTDNIDNSYNASTGTTGRQVKEYDRDGCAGAHYLPGQLDVFYNNPDLNRYDVDYVTLSIGGNDVGFEAIVAEAARNPVYGSPVYDMVADRLDHFDDPGGIGEKLTNTYRRVAEAAPNATIIVTGYPELLDYSGNGALFSEYGAKFINDGVNQFNWRIEKLIRKLKSEGIKIEFVNVAQEFRNHQAYSSDSYINGVMFGTQPQDLKEYGKLDPSPYSIHPNARGAEAYARCVQARIDALEAEKNQQLSEKQNIVLVLDTSGSMEGSPIQQTRSAAKSFIDQVLSGDASIGIVTYSSSASQRSSFSRNADALKSIVDGIDTGGMTNTDAGISTAASMLSGVTKGKRVIILMSDGLANEGRTGAELMEYIESLKNQGIYFYTLGFFEDLSGSDLSEGQSSMESIASPGYHYEVENADQLVNFFNDIADQINGQNYSYVRIACPVDVEVSCGGETLSSVTDSTRTSFGTLTFEAGDGDGNGRDDRTKILRLREDGTQYDIVISGNGEGVMNYTAGFMDENGEYTDLREIRDVPITEQTRINANADRNSATTLRVDADGDGRVDQVLTEGGPPPVSAPNLWWVFVLGGIVLAGGAAAVFLLLRKKRVAVQRPALAGGYVAPGVYPAPGAYPAPGGFTAPGEVPPAPPVTEHPASPTQPAGDLFCGNCGARHDGSAPFCGVCGAPLSPNRVLEPEVVQESELSPESEFSPEPENVSAYKYCWSCGAKVKTSATFCGTCGAKL